MRVFTGSLATETNTFAPMPTGLASFKDRGYFPAGRHPKDLNLFAGPLYALREAAPQRGWTLIEGMVASAQPSGTVTREAYEQLRDELLADLRGALPVDMVVLGLHGAMVADGYEDCEGDLLARVRQIVGPGVVVGAELDPHMHLSPQMVEQADVLVSMKEYPHTDVLERARELVNLCEAAAAGRVRPVAALQLATEMIAMRDRLAVHYPDVDTALDEAVAAAPGTVVLADRADNPGSGAPGDSTFVLERMIERGLTNGAIGPVWDPIAVRIAFEAGEGAKLALRIGGKIGPLSGQPLDLDCTVKSLRADMVMTGLAGAPTDMGDCALVEANGIEIVLVSIRNQALGTDVFTQLGCDLAAKRFIVVKSAQHFHASFSKIASQVIYVGAPGAATPHTPTLPYTRIRRPRWPLDDVSTPELLPLARPL